ncbi:MAG: DUF3352 domain-containing protein [Deltaproteobacteria bacterium]|nr:DUF3352 domain-containing protein [Deltaproteobacteria bacterium]
MKKTGAILGAICILAIGLYFLVTARSGKVAAADFLPVETLACVEQRDLGELLADFKASRLGRAMTGIDTTKIATDLGLAPEEINKIREARKQLDDFVNSPVFNEVLGQELTLALLPVLDGALDAPEKTAASSLLFIVKPRHNADLLEMMSSLFARKLEQTTTQHGMHSIKRYRLEEDKTLSVVTVAGYVIAAFDERLILASLDRYDSKQNTLAQNKEYIRLRHDFINAKLFAYVSMPALSEQTSRLTATLAPDQKEEIQKTLDQWKGWEGLAFGAWKEKGRIRDKAVVLFKKDKLNPLVAKMCSVKPVENKTLAMVPADILGYYWTNTLDMSTFWEMFTLEMKDSTEQIKAMEQDVKSFTGVGLQQLFAMFGSEAVFLLKEVATDGFIPLPNGAIFLKIDKEDDFVKMLRPLLAKTAIPVQSEDYKGVKLNALGVSLHPGLQPVYALHQGYLILASTVDLVKKIIDGGGLAGDGLFQQVNQGLNQRLTKVNNSVSFVRFSSLLKMMKELANWGGTMLSMQAPEVALKSKVVIEQLVLPLLDGLAMYEVIGSRSVIQDDAIVLESTTVLAP